VPIRKKAQFKSCAFLFALKKIKPDYLSIAKTSQPPLPKFTRALHQLQCPRNT
jgi:hypothetical protein